MQNVDTNKLEMLRQDATGGLLRPDGSPVPQNAIVFTEGELVALKGYTYKVAYINEASIVLEPVGVAKVGEPSLADKIREAALRRQIAERNHGKR